MAARSTTLLHVGTYARLHGRGLYPLREEADGWAVGDPFGDAANASFGVFAPRYGLHYLVDEAGHHVGIFRCRDGEWETVARIETNGAEPCHLALDAEESRLAIANYGSGSLTLFQLDPTNGLPIGPERVHRNGGRGPNEERQEGPHAHWVGFKDGWLYQTDLGTDQVLAFRVDGERMLDEPELAFAAPAGSGPRFIAFHPTRPIAFLVSELASSLTPLEVDGPRLTGRETLSTLPDGFSGESLGGHIVLNKAADRLYVTNRGHDSIAVFALAPDGSPSLLQHVPSAGESPRFLLLAEDEKRLFVANEEGGSVGVFQVADDGTLTQDGAPIPIPGAVFLFPT
jgi:6-phosphogluconolactonase